MVRANGTPISSDEKGDVAGGIIYFSEADVGGHTEAAPSPNQGGPRGLSFKATAGNILALAPPLAITWDKLDRALRILEGASRPPRRS